MPPFLLLISIIAEIFVILKCYIVFMKSMEQKISGIALIIANKLKITKFTKCKL